MPISLFPEIENVDKKITKFRLPTPPITRLKPEEIVTLFATDARKEGGISISLPDPRPFISRLMNFRPSPKIALSELRKLTAQGGFML